MQRRDLIRHSLTLALAASTGVLSTAALAAHPLRRVRPGDPAWPTPADWETLRRATAGALVKPTALVAACVDPASAACTSVRSHLHNPYFIGDQVSGTQVSGWFEAWEPGVSAYAVPCRRVADVVAAVDFARTRNLRLAVKGGGHSYQGTSNAADSLLLWTRAMHAITVHEAFVPQGGHEASVPAVTVEAGAMWMDVYDAVTTRAGRYVQGGGCATVGVAGLVQSGGFGSFSKRYGSAASSLLEAGVVTADGRHRTVNAHRDPDLFWALKGGGGGSFGVVTRLTLRTHELPEWFGAAYGTIKATSDAAFRRLIARFVEFYAGALFNPHWGESAAIHSHNELSLGLVSQGLDTAAARAIWQPFFDWVAASPGDFTVTDELGASSRAAREWWDVEARRRRGSTSVIFDDRPEAVPTHAWWSGDQNQVGAFLHGYDSAWLPQGLLEPGRRADLVDALFAASRHATVELHFNKGLAGAPAAAIEAARATATNPAVVDAFTLAIVANGSAARYPGLPGRSSDAEKPRADARAVDAAMECLFRVAPSPGSYVSESNYFNARWSDAFWGSNYPRLRAVKKRYDPDGLFFVHHGVGSEEWSPDGFTRRA